MSNIKKNFIWNMIGSVVNSFTSLIFLIIVTRINGVEQAGIFTFAFSLACLFQVVSNYSGRTFQVTNLDKNLSDSSFFYHRIFSCVFMWLLLLVYLFIKSYSLIKNEIIILFVIFRTIESFSEVLYATIQKNNELYKVGISLFLKGILGIVFFFIINYLSGNMIFAIIALIIVNLLIFIIYDIKNFNKHYEKKIFNFSNIKLIFKTGFFVFLFSFLTQYILNAPKYAIDGLMADEYQTIYGIISMPATFMILCSQLLIQPFLNMMTSFLENKKYNELFRLVFKICLIVFGIGLIANLCCYLIGIPILEFVYGISLDGYLYPLLIIIFGAIFCGISFIVSNCLIAMRKTFIQVILYVVISILITIISNKLIVINGIMGASIAYASAMFILGFLFFVVFYFYLKKLKCDTR